MIVEILDRIFTLLILTLALIATGLRFPQAVLAVLIIIVVIDMARCIWRV